MSKKASTIANFNCTFGNENKPMLEYFSESIFPALKSGIKRVVGEDEYFFQDVSIVKTNLGRFILRGILVRKTKLEVKTEYDETNGVTFTNKFYDSAPISLFNIYLDNHRMIYTTNQKGSPNIRSFNATIKYVVAEYIKAYNYKAAEEKEEFLPFPKIDVINIPSKKTISEKLKKVKKIKKLTFKLFNPNGDFNISETYDGLLDQLELLGSKRGAVTINSPSKFENVAIQINDTKGLAEAKLEVEFNDGGKGTIDHSSMGEKIFIDLPESASIAAVSETVTNTLSDKEELNIVSEENEYIYNRNKAKIIPLFK
ncbi:hypothetical protein JHL18_23605 [Clostridium sp. YIM B02505]|uniref:Uncharacterized protein n=1 Tax=Clostridium yunnanense TaxID=2800325 RepID=A0ABS1EW42_9CLOT|nr:hypothetical protein [Clostridium yunnanense]MBK1813606.1 hypothetical protein [Clostridium yunnanense]